MKIDIEKVYHNVLDELAKNLGFDCLFYGHYSGQVYFGDDENADCLTNIFLQNKGQIDNDPLSYESLSYERIAKDLQQAFLSKDKTISFGYKIQTTILKDDPVVYKFLVEMDLIGEDEIDESRQN